MDDIQRKRVRPVNENDVSKIGEYINVPHLQTWADALAPVNLMNLTVSDIALYIQQLSECFTAKLSAVRARPDKHFVTAMTSLDKIRRLREIHIDYLVKRFNNIRSPEQEGAAKGWSLASLLFNTILRETRLITAFEFMCRFVASKCGLDLDEVPMCLDGVKLRKNILKKIPPPKLFFSASGLGERIAITKKIFIPKELRFDPSRCVGCIDNLLVLHPCTPMAQMSMLQIYSCWVHLVDQALWMSVDREESTKIYINSLLTCTAETALESYDDRDGVIDMDHDYRSESAHFGINRNAGEQDVRIGGDGKLLEDDKKSKDKTFTANSRFFGEVCSMFVSVLYPQLAFDVAISPHLASFSSLKTKCGLSVLLMCKESEDSDVHRCRRAFKSFSLGVEKWIKSEMAKLENKDFRKRVVDRMRADAMPACSKELYLFNNFLTAPRDVSGCEEAWYPRNGMTHVMKLWYKNTLCDFLSDSFMPSVRALASLFVFDLQITMNNRKFDWLTRCYANRHTSIAEIEGMVRDKKHPYVLQIDDDAFVKLHDTFYRCNSIFDAISAWLINATHENGYELFIRGETTPVLWIQNILRDIAQFVDDETFRVNFSRDVHHLVRVARDRFAEDEAEPVDYVFK